MPTKTAKGTGLTMTAVMSRVTVFVHGMTDMNKDQIKNKMRQCAEMAADIASSIHEDTLDEEIDIATMLVGIDEVRHLLNRIEDYSEQYENAEE